ncbi:MAG: DMT family transporter [Hyphomicrobiaceae bacterium]|nr:DMT family transporter [Hyphomicrobiaceae bacterium]
MRYRSAGLRRDEAARGMAGQKANEDMPAAGAAGDAGAGRATLIGCGAILLWATLAPLTVLKGGIPPFETTAISFAVGTITIALAAIVRGRAHLLVPTPASLLLGVYGLFCFHALYFSALALAPPAEAHLLASLWALLIVLMSALLPGHRLSLRHLAAALIGFAAAAVIVWHKLGGQGSGSAGLGFLLALACAAIWSTYSVASRLLAPVAPESLWAATGITALLAALVSALAEAPVMPSGPAQWAALAALGLGPVGGAFVMWDVGMKHGRIATLGVLSYASPVLSTLLLVGAGLSQGSLALAAAVVLMTIAGIMATR